MAKLILSLDGMVLREYPLSKERTTIGRKSHNDIVIDNLAVSGEHAMIMTILNDSFLEDLGSTNGTLVNGQPVKKHFLQNNDVVELGKYKLKYVTEAVAQPAGADFEKTMVLRNPSGGGAAKPEGAPVKADAPEAKTEAAQAKAMETSQPMPKSFGDTVVNPEMMQSQTRSGGTLREAARQAVAGAPAAATAPAAAAAPPAAGVAEAAAAVAAATAPAPATTTQPGPASAGGAQGTIQILSGPSAGRELPLSKPLTTLGKPGVQVAVIAKRPQGYFITHVEGASYPVVNGKHLDAQAHALGDHDVIELAGVKMEFFLKPPG
ncbi:MAG TPA: FHA domain-containing protein [Burkholderiales bacterium]|nr:FHA domain-containing protein [Burkholderiales bacterium]